MAMQTSVYPPIFQNQGWFFNVILKRVMMSATTIALDINNSIILTTHNICEMNIEDLTLNFFEVIIV